MTIYVFGNPLVENDSLLLKILPELQKKFPDINFQTKDPNEEWEAPEELIIIDAVLGIDDVKVFESLENFSPAPNVTMHDFDAYANLKLLQKLGRLKKIKIIGIPPTISQKKAIEKISEFLSIG